MVLTTALTVVLTAVLLVANVHPNRPVEPSSQGRRLTDWLDDIAHRSAGERARGEKAVLAIGTNAIPFLLWELEVKHSPLKRKCLTWVYQQRWLGPFRGVFGLRRDPSEEAHHQRAVTGFDVLATAARPALSVLARLVKCPATALDATRILARYDHVGRLHFGSEAYAPLLDALTNPNPEARRLAANGLDMAQTNALVVVPALLRALHDPDPDVRAMAAMSLGGPTYKSQAQAIIPALINCLDDPAAVVRERAAKRLGLFHASARPALPDLFRLLNDPDGDVRTSVKWAIDQIEPESAPKPKDGIKAGVHVPVRFLDLERNTFSHCWPTTARALLACCPVLIKSQPCGSGYGMTAYLPPLRGAKQSTPAATFPVRSSAFRRMALGKRRNIRVLSHLRIFTPGKVFKTVSRLRARMRASVRSSLRLAAMNRFNTSYWSRDRAWH